MNKLRIDYSHGGFRKASKYLTWKHNANFSILLDAIIYIYNENLDKLIDISDTKGVKISNGFLSRNTGLSTDIIKRQVKLIENTGLITAIKKGQGNTRHYTIHIDNINMYLEVLENEFKIWFEDSFKNSKTDMDRSKKADEIKLQKSMKSFRSIIAKSISNSGKAPIGLVQNPPTQISKTSKPNNVKPTVVETSIIETKEIKTTTRSLKKARDINDYQIIKNEVYKEIFNKEDKRGEFIYIVELDKQVYKNDYVSKKKSSSDFSNKIYRVKDYFTAEMTLYDENFESEYFEIILNKNITPEDIPEDIVLKYLYNKIDKRISDLQRERRKKFKTTKEPARKEISSSNWKLFEQTYKDLPQIDNQGKFFVSKKDKNNFFLLSEYRQEYVISCVEEKEGSSTTASRPSIYIEEAKNDRLLKHKLNDSLFTVI